MAMFGKHKGHTAIHAVFAPGVPFLARESFVEFPVSERIYPYFVAAILEFREDIGREHPGIAAGHIQVNIFQFHQAEQHVYKPQLCVGAFQIRIGNVRHFLNFIQKDVINSTFVDHLLPHIAVQFQRIAIPRICNLVQCEHNDMAFIYPLREQIFTVKLEQQKGFSTPAHTGNHLNKSIFPFGDQLVQIVGAFNFHQQHLLLYHCVNTHF